jgi:cytochrome c oxidase subunit 1
MLGARDLAFPRLNLFTWYLFITGGAITLWALFVGGIDTGWTFYTPLSTMYSKGHVVMAAVGIFISGFASIATGLNFIVSIHRLRAPGLSWYRMPVFLWSIYSVSVLLVLATPVLAITVAAAGGGTAVSHRCVRPCDRRRPAAVPASVLVLLASRGLHHDPAGLRRGQ